MNVLGSTKEMVQNKLAILYIVENLDLPVSSNSITKLVLRTRLMNYFMFRQCLTELNEGDFMKLIPATGLPDGTKGYTLTSAGKNILKYFTELIPPGLKKQLDRSLQGSRKEIENDTLVTADYTPESENKYTVTCRISEKQFTLIEIKTAAGTKRDAVTICENWRNRPSEIYAEIIEALIKERADNEEAIEHPPEE